MCDIVNDVLTVVIFIIIVHVLRRGWGIWGMAGGCLFGDLGWGWVVAGGLSAPPPLKVFCQYAHFLKSPLNVPLK